MASVFDCPSCSRKLSVPDDVLGRQVRCPTCGATFRAPATPDDPAHVPEWEPPPPAPERRERVAASSREDRPSRRRPSRWDDDDFDDRPSRRREARSDLEPHRGTLILVLGILAIVLHGVGLILGPIAWILGNQDLAAMRAGRMDPEGEGPTNAGRICGMIATLLSLLGLLVFFLVFCLWLGMVGAFFRAA